MRTNSLKILCCITVLLITQQQGEGLRCLKCNDVISPKHCQNIELCEANEVCVITKFRNINHEILFNVGCQPEKKCGTNSRLPGLKRKVQWDATPSGIECSECCNGDLCNAAGCGEQGYPTQRGPVCLTCSQSRNTSTCDRIAVCADDEVCHVELNLELGDQFYTTACVSHKICQPIKINSVFGKRHLKRNNLKTVCKRCCNKDLCNDYCQDHTGFNITTASTTTQGLSTSIIPLKTSEKPSTIAGRLGREFWLAFPENYRKASGGLSLYLYLTSNVQSAVNITVQYRNRFTQNVTFNKTAAIKINAYMQQLPNVIEQKGIKVTADHEISVIGYSNDRAGLSDGFYVIPANELDTSYIAVSSKPYTGYNSYVSVVALHDNTTIKFSLSMTGTYSYSGQTYTGGDSFEISLDKFSSFQLSHTSDLTGTRIFGSEPICVLSGTSYALPPLGTSDNFYSVFVPPSSSFGNRIILPPFTHSYNTSVRIVPMYSSSNAIVQNQNGAKTHSISTSPEVYVPVSHASVISCSKPCMVAAYSYGRSPLWNLMTLIPSISQFSNNYSYVTPLGSYSHYMAIIIKSANAGSIMINNTSISSFNPISEALTVDGQSWTILTVKVDHGSYAITTTDDSNFYGVIAYGLQESMAYAFPLGMKIL